MNKILAASFQDRGVKWIGGGWSAFILENLVLSHNRESIIERFGDHNYHITYNCLSSLACASIAYGYFRYGRQQGVTVAPPGKFRLLSSLLVRSLGLIGIAQLAPKLQIPIGFKEVKVELNQKSQKDSSIAIPTQRVIVAKCPIDFRPINAPKDEIYGLDRVSRHANLWCFGLICLGTALKTTFVPEMVMFGFPIVFAYIGGAHQDHRFRNNSGGILTPEKEKITSNIPFIALMMGRQSWEKLGNEIKWENTFLALALSLFISFRKIKKI